MNSASLKSRLRNLAIKEKKPYDYIQMHYMIERLLYRVSISPYAHDFVLKGGLLLHIIFEDRARATRDIDFLARHMSNDPEHMKRVFEEICAITCDDAVEFDAATLVVEPILKEANYSGVHVKVFGYIERSRNLIEFDIGFGDAVVPRPEEMVYPSLLGLDETRLLAYSKESVIAEKFQAMVYLAEGNSRMKDFYDIYMLSTSFGFDGACLSEAVYETFTRRATPLSQIPVIFTDGFMENPDKQVQWSAFCKRIHIEHLTFSEVIVRNRAFLAPLYEAIVRDERLIVNWNPEKAEWC